MNILILMFLTLTNLQTGAPYGDPLSDAETDKYHSFKSYLYLSGNFALTTEYRYRFVYDTYNSTVGRQVVYDNRMRYLLKPEIWFGFSYWNLKTLFYYRGLSDRNYNYKKIIYTSGYVPEDTILIERKGDITEGGIKVISVLMKSFLIGGGAGLLTKSDSSGLKRALNPSITMGYVKKTFGVTLEYSPKAKFSEETEFGYPQSFSILSFYVPQVKAISRIEAFYKLLHYNEIDTNYSNYYIMKMAVTHNFRDQTFLRIGGVLEKTYVRDYYIPGIELGFGYSHNFLSIGVNFEKTFFNYTDGSEIIEESPLKIKAYLKYTK
ncbi:MAG: hypothetical protein ABIM02_01210 [candidate division WOR-3 bacterium]